MLAIDLFCGLGGWAEGLLAEGWDVVGFDIERHVYGAHRYPAQLVLQDVLTLHGSQFREAALIVASPPCQAYSWMAMPWKRAKARAAEIRADETGMMLAELNRLFEACFRIQAQASLAAGRRIPLVVENVRGAQPWVGRARWNFGSFYLWGDVPALMPFTAGAAKWGSRAARRAHKVPGFRFDGSGRPFQSASAAGMKGVPHRTARHWTNPAEHEGVKQHGSGREWWDGALDERRREATAIKKKSRKQPGINLSEIGFNVANAREFGVSDPNYRRTDDDKRQHTGSSRKAASALIAKIPLALARHIGASYRE